MNWPWQWWRKPAAPQAAVPEWQEADGLLSERIDTLEEANRGILELLQRAFKEVRSSPVSQPPSADHPGEHRYSGGVTCPTCRSVHHPAKSCPRCARERR